MNNESVNLVKAIVNSDIKQFQTQMREMVDRRITEKIRERRDQVFERCGFKRIQDNQ